MKREDLNPQLKATVDANGMTSFTENKSWFETKKSRRSKDRADKSEYF